MGNRVRIVGGFVASPKAQFKGVGTINGRGDYRFMLTAIEQIMGRGVD